MTHLEETMIAIELHLATHLQNAHKQETIWLIRELRASLKRECTMKEKLEEIAATKVSKIFPSYGAKRIVTQVQKHLEKIRDSR